MSYLDIGYNDFLTKQDTSRNLEVDPFQFDQFTASISGDKITTMLEGNLVGEGINADNITTGEMRFDRARGGNLILGGLNNQYGEFALRDEGDADRITMNKDGIVVNEGAISVKDTNNNILIDSTGLVSTTAFNWYNIFNATDRTATGTAFADIANTGLNFNLLRPTTILFLVTADIKKDAYTAQDRLLVKLGINIDGTLYPSSTDGFGVVYHYSDAASNSGFICRGYVGANYLITLNKGAHYATLQWANYLPSPAAQNRMVSYTSLTALLLGK